MIYRRYGKTGIEVSAVGFGGMRFADQGDVDYCASLLKAAYDKGINYFDTAPGYGKSEELFGVAFKEMKKTRAKKPFYVSTKTMKAEPSEIRRQLETSLKRMSLDYVDFYHFWCVMSLDAYRDRRAKGALDEFEKLRSEGLIRHICVSSHMTGADISSMLADYPFEGVLLGYSAMNFAYRQGGLQAAADRSLGVVVMNPLGGGLIPRHPELFGFVKTHNKETIVQGAIRFLLADQRVTIVLVGFSTHEHIAEATSAAGGLNAISPGDVKRIRDSLKEAFNELCTACNYCDNCPKGIPVPKMMDVYNQYVLTGKSREELIERVHMHWGIDLQDNYLDRCTECGACEVVCTQRLPICVRLREIRREIEQHVAQQSKP